MILGAVVLQMLLATGEAAHVIQVPPLDEVRIALEVEPGHPDAEGHITHVLAGCAPYSEVYDSRTSCVVAYLDHGSPRIRQLHFRHSGRFTPETWDTWGIVNEEPQS
jgi:hypothetical protein